LAEKSAEEKKEEQEHLREQEELGVVPLESWALEWAWMSMILRSLRGLSRLSSFFRIG
jgi:hypothetical protein